MSDNLTPAGESAVRLALEVGRLRHKLAAAEALAAEWEAWREDDCDAWSDGYQMARNLAGTTLRAALEAP